MYKLLALALLTTTIGCTQQKKGVNHSFAFTNDSIVSTSQSSEIRAYFPVFDHQFADSVVGKMISQQIEQFKEAAGEGSTSDNWTNELNIQFKVEQHNGELVTVIFDQYYFTGGAHGNTIFANAVMDLRKGKTYNLTDFFNANPLASIQGPVREKLKTQIDFQDFINDGTASLKDFEIFSLNDSLITFYFTPYQVAPYAYGTQKVSLPLATLNDFKKPE